ncbi:hypothetical protein ACFYY8_18385 [Streptosporangium sp. NPDC001559]|uniref:hypothetical protein n=1 Tax=Streptosporangium sp. NPDC001559 TaxID=3366187 RepID=UPI0036EBD967
MSGIADRHGQSVLAARPMVNAATAHTAGFHGYGRPGRAQHDIRRDPHMLKVFDQNDRMI